MEEGRVKRFQIGDSISPSSFVPVKRKSRKDPCNLWFNLLQFIRMITTLLTLFRRQFCRDLTEWMRIDETILSTINLMLLWLHQATDNGSNNHANTANGTISSSTESSDSVEPPKQPFNVSNKDFNERSNVCNEHCNSENDCDGVAKQKQPDSNQSNNDQDSNVVCSVLNENVANHVGLYDSCGVNLNSNKTPPSPALSRNDKLLVDKQNRADKDSHHTDEHSSNGNIDNRQECTSEFNDVCKKSHTTNDDGITIANIERFKVNCTAPRIY